MQDGANERSVYYGNYGNRFYMPFNPSLRSDPAGSQWPPRPQFLAAPQTREFIDQSGNVLPARPSHSSGRNGAWYRPLPSAQRI